MNSRVSFICDMWIYIQKNRYCVLTCHYIDLDWFLQKRFLNFFMVDAPHTANAITLILLQIIYSWNLDSKIYVLFWTTTVPMTL